MRRWAAGLGRAATLLLGDISFLHDINGLNLLRTGEKHTQIYRTPNPDFLLLAACTQREILFWETFHSSMTSTASICCAPVRNVLKFTGPHNPDFLLLAACTKWSGDVCACCIRAAAQHTK